MKRFFCQLLGLVIVGFCVAIPVLLIFVLAALMTGCKSMWVDPDAAWADPNYFKTSAGSNDLMQSVETVERLRKQRDHLTLSLSPSNAERVTVSAPPVPMIGLAWNCNYNGMTNVVTTVYMSEYLSWPLTNWFPMFSGQTNQCWVPMLLPQEFFIVGNSTN